MDTSPSTPPAPPPARSRRRTWAFRALNLLFLILLVELACCVFLKVKRVDPVADGWAHNYARFRQYELNPRFSSKERTGGRRPHSPDGFREDAAVAKKKPEGVFRVIAMGGSTLYGLGTDGSGLYPFRPNLGNDETIDYFLEKAVNEELARQGVTRKVEIINAAAAGYHTYHHLIYLNEILYEYEPDLVIFLDGHNDFYFTRPRNHWRDGSTVDLFTNTGLNNQNFLFTAQMNVRFLAKYSSFFQVIEYMSRSRTGAIGVPPRGTASAEEASDPAFKERVKGIMRTTFLREYTQIRALGKHLGFEMAVFLQPELELEDAGVLNEKDAALRDIRVKNTPANTALAMTTIRSMLPEVFQAIDVPFNDVSTIATASSKGTQLYVDYCHLTPDGSRTLAEKMKGPLAATVSAILKK